MSRNTPTLRTRRIDFVDKERERVKNPNFCGRRIWKTPKALSNLESILQYSGVLPEAKVSQRSGNRSARRKVFRTKEVKIFTKGSYRRFVSALLFFDQHFNGETRVGGGCVILATMVHSS